MSSLASLPEVSFCETDAAKVRESILAVHQAITSRTLYPGDPERLFLEVLAEIITRQRTIIDHTGKMNLLRYASGDFLDHKGAERKTPRLPASPALTTLRFSLDASLTEGLGYAVPIPAGTRATPDGKIYFATSEYASIPDGALSVDVPAACLEAGTVGNGFVASQVNRLVDPVDYVARVANTTTTTGGADVEADEAYRERIRQAPESYSVAGPRGAYRYWAMSAHQDIIDVAVYSLTPCVVSVRPLLKGGELPGADILAAVTAMLDAEERRPDTDSIDVQAPTPVTYNVTLDYWIDSTDAPFVTQIQERVQEAVENYLAWQRGKLGRDINPSKLLAMCMGAGAKRVEIASPVFQALERWEVAQDGLVTLNYRDVEDE